LICAIELLDESLDACHVIDPWHLENTNCVVRKHNWAVGLELISYINPRLN
jgi:hypothetical protein